MTLRHPAHSIHKAHSTTMSSFTVDVEIQDATSKAPTTTKRPPRSGISVLIVGAGPVGVYTALECWRKGHDVRIIERNPSASTQGVLFGYCNRV